MNKNFSLLALLLITIFLSRPSLAADGIDLEQIRLELVAKKAKWQVIKNKFTEMSAGQRAAFLGAKPLLDPKPLQQRSRLTEEQKTKILPLPAEAGSVAQARVSDPNRPPQHGTSVDWRLSGLAAVKNQQSCGACIPFSMSSTLEDQLILRRHAFANTPLSPQFIFACSQGTCAGGTTTQTAANFVRDTGVVTESCVPYTSGAGVDAACTGCQGWERQAVRFNHVYRNGANTSFDDLMEAVYNQGPIVAQMTVYQDFFAYSSGVYTHTTGEVAGVHGVEIVGYDQAGRYWIARNSWGADWGENGYFRISWDDTSGLAYQSWQFWPTN